MVNRLFELAKLGASEYPVHPEPLPLRQTVDAILADCDREGLTLDSTAVGDSTVTADRANCWGAFCTISSITAASTGPPRRAAKVRSQMIWRILGLMLGSLYAIANGPASLATPRPALSMATFQPVGFVLGATVLLALESARMMMERKEQPGVPIVKGEK